MHLLPGIVAVGELQSNPELFAAGQLVLLGLNQLEVRSCRNIGPGFPWLITSLQGALTSIITETAGGDNSVISVTAQVALDSVTSAQVSIGSIIDATLRNVMPLQLSEYAPPFSLSPAPPSPNSHFAPTARNPSQQTFSESSDRSASLPRIL